MCFFTREVNDEALTRSLNKEACLFQRSAFPIYSFDYLSAYPSLALRAMQREAGSSSKPLRERTAIALCPCGWHHHLQLLNRDWTVTIFGIDAAVREEIFSRSREAYLKELTGKLILRNQEWSVTLPSHSSRVHFILAHGALTYCHPAHILTRLQDTYNSLFPGGYFVGFFLSKEHSEHKKRQRSEGKWFVREEVARFLLERVGYRVEKLELSPDDMRVARLHFVCRKCS